MAVTLSNSHLIYIKNIKDKNDNPQIRSNHNVKINRFDHPGILERLYKSWDSFHHKVD